MTQHEKHLWSAEVQPSKREGYSLKRKEEKRKNKTNKNMDTRRRMYSPKMSIKMSAVCDLRIDSS